MKILSKKVLLLNQSFEPLAILPVKKVLKKLLKGSTSLLVEEYYDDLRLVTDKNSFRVPSVVRLSHYLSLKKATKTTTGKKAKIFMRDQYKCFYCNYAGTPETLTVDHIIPKSKGGTSSPDNLITSCKRCNGAKSDTMPDELGIKIPKSLLHSNINYAMLVSAARNNEQWKKYLFV